MPGDLAGSISTFPKAKPFLSPKRVTFQCIFRYSVAPTKEPAEIPTCGALIKRQSGPNSETGMRPMSFVRDNGCGINPEAVQRECDSHWGLRGMRERAEHISARFGIWSRTGAGTEVCVAIPIASRSDNPWMVRPRTRDESRLAREQREQQQLESVGSNEKQSVDEGSAATPKNGGDILGCRSQQ